MTLAGKEQNMLFKIVDLEVVGSSPTGRPHNCEATGA
jgi:hypothetical protein